MTTTNTRDLEHVRAVINFLTQLLQSHENLAQNLAEARWMYEMLKEHGEDSTRITAANQSFKQTREQFETSAEVLLTMTGFDTIQEVRQKYQELVTAFNTMGEMRDQIIQRETLLTIYNNSGTIDEEGNDDVEFSSDKALSLLERLRKQVIAAEDLVFDLVSQIKVPDNLTSIVKPKIQLV